MKFFFVSFLIVLAACSKPEEASTLFQNVTQASGVQFENMLSYTEDMNPYTYRNFYNGAGVAIGDINNDGLLDIYFTGNQVNNKLYLNKGNFQFEDITEKAGVACAGVWSTGVTMADINGDGLLDIYVCKSGNPDTGNRHNELFINNGDLTFTEQSKQYGLDFVGLAVQAAFFDYDKDGDLDCYLLTNSFKSVGNYDLVEGQRAIPDATGGGNKFLVNDGGIFKDHSQETGIYRSAIGFGLGITLGDFNSDSWTDVFISNDFFERDYLYINNQNGTFTESLTHYFESISMGSMGADFADLDNDGQPELFVTEMLPDSLNRKKTKTIYESWNKYQLNVANGYFHQFSRNVLQTRIGKTYAEVGRWSGVAATEWSWGALLFDMDNDGLRDIFVANGIYKDLLDRDYLTYTGAEENIRKIIQQEENAIIKLIDLMPSSSFSNYAFHNEGDLRFSNKAKAWGLEQPMYSSGSAYGDLDNDGDLDLVVNNLNASSVVYQNTTDSSRFKHISLSLSSSSQNRFAVGSVVTAYVKDKIYLADNFVTKGFQSSVQPRVTIGLGPNVDVIDSIVVQWPEGKRSVLLQQKANQHITLNSENARIEKPNHSSPTHEVQFDKVNGSYFVHRGSEFNDFNRDRLLPFMLSDEMPALVKGDIDGDGVAEVYVGGGKDQSGSFLKFGGGAIRENSPSGFQQFALGEETKGALFDADQDGDLDFYMATGGRFFPAISSAQEDKLFLNDGKGNFILSSGSLPFANGISTSVVKSFDVDQDGDLDLFVGERFDPFFYGKKSGGFLLQNNGQGKFTDITKSAAQDLVGLGMITDAVVCDFNADGWQDIVLVGDWLPVTFLQNQNGRLEKVDIPAAINSEGWWHAIVTADLNKDGKPDFVLGNHGLNTFFKVSDRMYVHDFDGNGSIEQIFCTRVGDSYYPIVDRDELLSQLPALKKSLLYYHDYSKKTITSLFSEKQLQDAKMYQVNELTSKVLLSQPNGYQWIDLPNEAQFAPLYSLIVDDLDGDGVLDLVAGGNQYAVKPQFGRYDASRAWFFKGIRSGNDFNFLPGEGLNVTGQIRDIEIVTVNGNKMILFAKYDDELEIFKIRN